MFVFFFSAWAIPLHMTQQGRVLDDTGAALSGTQNVTFSFHSAQSGGDLLWSEELVVSFRNGYYAALLGTDTTSNPLDSAVLSLYPLFLEIQINSHAPMVPRQPVTSVPYAQIAGTAESVDGGIVNASQISIQNNTVIDGNGNWVGNSIPVAWGDIDQSSIPSYLLDGDDNTQLLEEDVETYITNGPIDLDVDSTIGGKTVVNDPNCAAGEILSFDGLEWVCATDQDTQLNETDIQNLIQLLSILVLPSGTTLAGESIMTESSVVSLSQLDTDGATSDQVLSFDGSQISWTTLQTGGGGGVEYADLYQRTASSSSSPTAYCDDADDLLLHGGCNCPQTQIWKSQPINTTSSTSLSGWQCYAGNAPVTAYAVCISR